MSRNLVTGVLIDKARFNDKSLIIRLIASDGRLISGVYFESKSKTPLQFLNFYSFLVSEIEGKDLQKFYDINILEGYRFYDFSPEFSEQYFLLAEISRQLFREEDPGEDIFSFLNVELRYFSGQFRPDFHITFLCKLITLYGYMPERPYSGKYFDLRGGFFTDSVPVHPDYCESVLIIRVFDFVNGNSDSLSFSQSKERFTILTQILRFIELQKGIRIRLNSIEVLRDLRN